MGNDNASVHIVERDRYADVGVASGPVFAKSEDAEAFIAKHSPTSRVFGKDELDWFSYEMTVHDSLESGESELAKGARS